jgi:Flp pilus assembly protein TadB
MSTATALTIWVLLAAGVALLLNGAPWFRRTPLVQRLAPYARRSSAGGVRTTVTLQQVIAPWLEQVGARAGRAVGVTQDLATRLERAGRDVDPAAFRVTQFTRALVALLVSAGAVVALGPPPATAALAIAGAPLLALLATEQQVGAAIDQRRRDMRAELPVVAEQLGLLLAAGYSLPSAIGRLAERSDGVVATDLQQVARRIRQGLGTSEALAEWAERAGLDTVDRLVAVLRLHDDAGDLGMLIAEEARSIRAAAHRDLLEQIERRAQLVWVPVTVATLVPGLIFLAVPFMSAMAQVTGG